MRDNETSGEVNVRKCVEEVGLDEESETCPMELSSRQHGDTVGLGQRKNWIKDAREVEIV